MLVLMLILLELRLHLQTYRDKKSYILVPLHPHCSGRRCESCGGCCRWMKPRHRPASMKISQVLAGHQTMVATVFVILTSSEPGDRLLDSDQL